jgi:hypothetical protein
MTRTLSIAEMAKEGALRTAPHEKIHEEFEKELPAE